MLAQLRSSWKLLAAAAGIFGSLIFSPAASAAPIGNASFGIGGAFTVSPGTHLGTTNSIFISNGGQVIVTAPDTMDLAGLVHLNDTGTLKDLPNLHAFTAIGNYLTLSNGVSLDLNTLTIWSQSGPAPGYVNLSGDVTIRAPGFDPTVGKFTFTGTTSDNTTFTLAVTTSTVPEPLSLTLLGLGLIGMFVGMRRRRNFAQLSA